MQPSSERPTARARTVCVGSRVDALTIAFAVELATVPLRELRHAAEAAHEAGGASELCLSCSSFDGTDVGSFYGELRAPRDRGVERWMVRNADVRGIVHPKATGGWSVELHATAAFLATRSLELVIAHMESLAAAFGKVTARRVRRVDVCADFLGFPLDVELSDSWFIIPRRGRIGDFIPRRTEDAWAPPRRADDHDEAESPERRRFRNAKGKVTGYSVCAGNDLSARIYDKTAELQLSGREHKKEIEHARWSQHEAYVSALAASTPADPLQVTRVEYQLRGVALDDCDMRGLHTDATGRRRSLASILDAVWQYLTQRWLRLAEQGDEERADRRPLDERWRAVQAVRFKHDAAPIIRHRRRGGATPEQAFGAMTSSLAAEGRLPRVRRAAELLEHATKEEKSAIAQSLIMDAHMTSAILTARHWEQRYGEEAAADLITRWNATVGRFASLDDRTLPPLTFWRTEPSTDPTTGASSWIMSEVVPGAEDAAAAHELRVQDAERAALRDDDP